MKLARCPVCHAHIHLDALVQDDAGRELMGLLAGLDAGLGRALVGYLTLWRPAKGDLANDRALRLAREVLGLCTDYVRLERALAETVEAIRAKGEARRMGNHNYLLRVLESTPGGDAVALAQPAPAAAHKRSKTAQAMLALARMAGDTHA